MTKATFERIERFIYIMHYHQFKFSYDIKALSNPIYTSDHLLRLEKVLLYMAALTHPQLLLSDVFQT